MKFQFDSDKQINATLIILQYIHKGNNNINKPSHPNQTS